MRPEVDAARVQEFMRELGRSTSEPARVYLVGGTTAVLHGWRAMTADLDIKFVSEVDLGPVLSESTNDQPPATETRHFIGLSVSLQLLPTVINRGVCH